MTEFDWQQIRDDAIAIFADAPSAQLEQELVEHFTERPSHTAQVIARIGKQVQAGKVRSGWAVVRKELNSAPGPNIRATDEAERERRIRNAETWIRNAGLYLDRQQDLEDELFGDRGTLRDYAKDDTLRARMVDYWRTHRPRGEQAEQDAEAWMAKCANDRKILLEQRKPKPEPEPVTADADIAW